MFSGAFAGKVIGRSSSWSIGSEEEVETTSGHGVGGGLHLLLRPEARLLQQAEQWCVAKEGEANSALQGALDWTCGPLEGQGQVDCSPIQSTGICYLPNTLQDHSSWAFNEYYQQHLTGADSCDFGGNAVITTTNPSKQKPKPSCRFSFPPSCSRFLIPENKKKQKISNPTLCSKQHSWQKKNLQDLISSRFWQYSF